MKRPDYICLANYSQIFSLVKTSLLSHAFLSLVFSGWASILYSIALSS